MQNIKPKFHVKSINDIQVVVLMGGLGTRIKDHYPNVPKSMVPVFDKPFFYYQLELMRWYGFKKFIFCVGYEAKQIQDYFIDGKDFGVNIKYSYDTEKLLGTGGALRNAMDLLEDDFMLIYGDSYMDIDYPKLIYKYSEMSVNSDKKGLMVVYENYNKLDKSNVIFDETINLIKYDKISCTKDMHYIDYGIAILKKEIIIGMSSGEVYDLSDVYKHLSENNMLYGFKVSERFYEIGRLEPLEEFKEFIHNRKYIKTPAIFLDRDGTINELFYNEDIEQLDSPLKPSN